MDVAEPAGADGLPLEDAGAEDESDLSEEPAAEFEKAVVTATDWTTETIATQLDHGNIELNPAFQRRDAWAKSNRKSLFIESLFLGLPIPQIVLAEKQGERGSFIVIDGKQRLLALRQFAATEASGFVPLALSNLEIRRDLEGLTLARMRDDPQFRRDVRAYDNETIRCVIVRSWPSEDFLYRVFLRLNTGTLPLSTQELRQALHPGPFVNYADAFALGSDAVRRALRLHEPDFRMRDVELVVRYFAFDRFLPDYRGDLKAFLDDTCEQLNLSWPTAELEIAASGAALESAIDTTFDVFESLAFRRWNGKAYEGSFNRAVFDCMTYFFKHASVATRAKNRRVHVKAAFEQLCGSDSEFQQALVTTTKSTSATHLRLERWGDSLGEAIGKDLASLKPRSVTRKSLT